VAFFIGERLMSKDIKQNKLSDELINECHPTKNKGLTPYDVTRGSNKKIWWMCKKGHEWEAVIGNRTNGSKCPYCSNKKTLKGFNDLSTTHPELSKEWHPTKNGDLKPNDVTRGSGKRVWWKCNKGHEWQATVYNRSIGRGCHYCSNQKVLKGFNDLATNYPEIAKEWHYTKNGNLTPNDIISGSNKKAWWICDKGHEWEAVINNRTSGIGCPYCSNKKTLKGYNDLATTHPQIAKEWHPTKNKKLRPSDITFGSNKKVWWMCSKGHEWQAQISNRTNGNDCPYCSGKKALKGYNDLATTNPELAKEWHPTENGDLTPNDVTRGSSKKIWWKCKKGHEWQATIKSRSNGVGCPYCSNKKALKGYNDLKTTNPQIAKEWHPSKNKNLLPSNVTPFSHKRVWWICNKGHEWDTAVAHRSKGRGCPYCKKEKQSSFPELAIYFYIKKVFKDAIHSYKINNTEIDIYIPSLKIGIEYDGVYWHKNKIDKDTNKNIKLIKNDITLLRVRENGLEEINISNCYNYFLDNDSNKSLEKSIKWIFDKISVLTNTNIGSIEININKDEIEILNTIDYIDKERSIATKNPELVKEWHPTKNGNLTPYSFSYGSGKKAWWKCSKGHEWQAIINSRSNGIGCPYCSGQKALKGYDDLKTVHQKIAKEWHSTKNGKLTPNDVKPGSGKKVWWKCSHCNEEYARRICDQVKFKKCPKCKTHIE
jgi:glutaredoxin